MVILLYPSFVTARKVVKTSDNIRPHWCEGVSDIYRDKNPTYEYIPLVDEGMNRDALKANRALSLKNHFQQKFDIKGEGTTEYIHSNEMGKIADSDYYKITFKVLTSVQEFYAVFIDEYWEQYEDGEYRLYSLYAVSIPNVKPHFYGFSTDTHYRLHEGFVRSLIPGWGQFYKGNKTTGSLIISGEAIGVAGIITSFSMKSRANMMIKQYPKYTKQYSQQAHMWQNIGYGCIAFTAAVYIYNLLDATLAPGARRVFVYYRRHPELTITPTASFDGSMGLSLKYNF